MLAQVEQRLDRVDGADLEVVREGLEVRGMLEIKKNFKHVLTHRVLYADFWLWETNERPTLPDDYFWIKESDIDQYAVPRLIELLLNEL